jgi:hypothetical protein
MVGRGDPTVRTREELQDELATGPGFVVLRGLVDDDLIEDALRRLNLEILHCGITPEQIGEWKYATFWPTLRWEPEILAVRQPLERVAPAGPGEQWGDAQLLVRFPDEADDWPLTPHVDDPPEWSGVRSYEMIFGVALSRARAIDGCLTVWQGSHRGEVGERCLVELDPGDVVVLHPQVGHSSTLNRGGHLRYAVYFRLLGAPA